MTEEPRDAVPDEERPAKTRLDPATVAVPQAPLDAPWSFRRINEHGHVHFDAKPGTADVVHEGVSLPIRSHARVYAGELGPQVGTAVVHPDGRVEGTVTDPYLGSRLVRHVGFNAIAATFNRVVINDRELDE